jgi:DNA-directed RNA polymerase subunit RPC12/RpoP
MSEKTVYTCDRCKSEIEKWEDVAKFNVKKHQHVEAIRDVCPTCYQEFGIFWHSEVDDGAE